MDALRADSGDAIVLVTPAFPETGRTIYQGNLFVGSVPLNESPLKDHPLNPMHDSNLVRVLARQSKTKIGLVDLAAIARGPDAVRARLADLAGQGLWRRHRRCRIRPRSGNHRHGRAGSSCIGRRLRHRARPCPGAGGVRPGEVACGEYDVSEAAVGGPAACLAGSCSQATLAADRQSRAERCRCCISIPTRSSQAKTKPGARWPGRKNGSGKGPVLIA